MGPGFFSKDKWDANNLNNNNEPGVVEKRHGHVLDTTYAGPRQPGDGANLDPASIGAVHAARHPVEPTPQGVEIEDARVLAHRMADNADAN